MDWRPSARASISCSPPKTRKRECTRSWKSEEACSKEGREMAVEVEQHVKLEIEGGVAWIRMSRPEKLNAIGALMRAQLAEAIKQAERDDAAPVGGLTGRRGAGRVVVLRGRGRPFSAGGDIGEMDQGMDARTPDELGRVLRDEYGA